MIAVLIVSVCVGRGVVDGHGFELVFDGVAEISFNVSRIPEIVCVLRTAHSAHCIVGEILCIQ